MNENPADMAQRMQTLKGFYQPGMAGAAPGGLGSGAAGLGGALMGGGGAQPQGGGMMPVLQGYQQNMQAQQPQAGAQPQTVGYQPPMSVTQQWTNYMGGGAKNPQDTVGTPTTDDEWKQKLYMDEQARLQRATQMSEFLAERERRGNSG